MEADGEKFKAKACRVGDTVKIESGTADISAEVKKKEYDGEMEF